jgi:hypothetical protein
MMAGERSDGLESHTGPWDVFVSHWSGDAESVGHLVAGLRSVGLTVWFDADAIETHESITRRVRDGIAKSKLLLAYYSRTYPTRRACQWELTAAFTAAQHLGDPVARVVIVNPERTSDGSAITDHIYPVELRDAKFATPPSLDDPNWQVEAARLAAAAADTTSLLGDGIADPPPEIPRRLLRAPSFVGRVRDLWAIHSGLAASDAVLITGAAPGDALQVVGLGGIGKSLAAEEYALRFAGAYPGGLYLLDAGGNESTGGPTQGNGAHLATQLREIASALGVSPVDLSDAEVRGAVRSALRRGGRSLWIVDNLLLTATSPQPEAG